MTTSLDAWVRFAWKDPFVWKRLASTLVISLLPAAVCLALGQGVLALLVMAVGLWPFPFRLSVSAEGVTCSWLFVQQTIAFSQMTFVRIIQDPRPWALFRSSVLAVGRKQAPDLLVFAKESTLRKLELAIRSERGPGV